MDGSDRSSMSHETVQVKQEVEWTNDAETWAVSEAAARAGLYAGHEIKRELVLGPEVLHQPEMKFITNVSVKKEWEVPIEGGEPTVTVRDDLLRLKRRLEVKLRGTHELTRSTHNGKGKKMYYIRVTAEEAYACPICRKTFALRSRLTEHVVVHIYTPASPEPDEGRDADSASVPSARALACGQQPPAPPQRRAHHTHTPHTEHTHSNETHYCQICHKGFIWPSQLKSHTYMDTKPYICEVCKKVFKRLDSLEMHRRIHTVSVKEERECEAPGRGREQLVRDCVVRLERCPALEGWGSGLLTRTTHGGEGTYADKNNDSNMKVTAEEAYACPMCRRSFVRKSHLTEHVVVHIHTPESLKQEEGSANDSVDMQPPAPPPQRRAHHTHTPDIQPTHKCKICNRYFSRSQYLKVHQRIHTAQNLFVCQICSKQFITRSHLKRHELVHAEMPLSGICDIEFESSQCFNDHKLLHSTEKLFYCEICARPFNHMGNLNRHRSMHTKPKFPCSMCSINFGSWQHLLSHQEFYHSGVQIENSLPETIQLVINNKLFQTELKKFLVDKSYNSIDQLLSDIAM